MAITTVDTATGARLATGITMQPAFAVMTWRYWSPVPTADTVVPDHTQVISVTKANGQVQDTLTYTAAAMNRATVYGGDDGRTAVAALMAPRTGGAPGRHPARRRPVSRRPRGRPRSPRTATAR